jgi:putative two-component system response regulator
MRAQRPGDILLVDSDEAFLESAAKVLRASGHHVSICPDSAHALRCLENHFFDILVCAQVLPDGSGAQMCRTIKATDQFGHPLIALLIDLTIADEEATTVLAEYQSLEVRENDALQPDDVILVPLRPEMLAGRLLALLRTRRYLDETKAAIGALMQVAEGVEEQDRAAKGHCKRLATMSIELGAVLGCDDWELTTLERAGYLHDIGMVTIHGALAHKTSSLSTLEMEHLKTHTLRGVEICRAVAALKPVLPIIRSHHERGDGTGYPDKLKGDEIPRLAQIFAIPHLYEALRLSRPYRGAMSESRAVQMMQNEVQDGCWNDFIFTSFVEHVLPGLEERLDSMHILWSPQVVL